MSVMLKVNFKNDVRGGPSDLRGGGGGGGQLPKRRIVQGKVLVRKKNHAKV